MILHLLVCRGQLPVSWITRKAVSMYLPILSQCYRFYSVFVLCLTIRPLHLQEGLHGPPLLLDGALGRKNKSASRKWLLLQIIIFVLLFIIIAADLLITDQCLLFENMCCLCGNSCGFGGNGGLIVCQHFRNNFSVPTVGFALLLLSLHASWWGSFSRCAAVITVIVFASSGIMISSCISKKPLVARLQLVTAEWLSVPVLSLLFLFSLWSHLCWCQSR